jgi:exodeoxyribonuclease VII large subunit
LDTKVYSVSEITQLIREVLEESFPVLWIEGEISNFRPHHSGHLYFTLKDANAQISCVMWRSRAASLAMQIEDGLKIRVFGNIRLYEKAGRYQLDILKIEAAGIGDLQILFEQLKQKLLEEGLFDPDHKKNIPAFPQTIGIITSPTGAAIKDILSVLRRRSPSTKLIFKGVKVQGEGAASEIVQAIQLMNDFDDIDVIILGRGGGSLEDLWPFNEEIVARAIFASKIPVISAVGHEIDFTITDFVADLRAATPSAAAEIAVPADSEISDMLQKTEQKLGNLILDKIGYYRSQLRGYMRAHAFRRPENILFQHMQRIDELSQRLNISLKNYIQLQQSKLNNLQHHLSALHPENVLQRGYSISFKDDKIISSVKAVTEGDQVIVKLKDGSMQNTVTGTYNE